MSEQLSISCPLCHAVFKRSKAKQESQPLLYCAYCGSHFGLDPNKDKKVVPLPTTQSIEKAPDPKLVQTTLGRYQIIKSIGKGGMGEVFLAYDTVCGRYSALKRIRADLTKFPQLQARFVREARVTAQLTHPAIIPIYSIDCDDSLIYYSMPYVEGETLKQLIRRAKESERKGARTKEAHGSIPFLVRQFLLVCQAVAYAHSKRVLHRDLKPENVIIGKYGQVLILDWGLAKILGDEEEQEFKEPKRSSQITRVGKVVGTISFMAPERAEGKPASIQTDIYSLGVMLYQLLTLTLPFRRKNLASFKKHWKKEQLILPEVMAPYRDVPQVLSEAVKRCLAVDEKARYHSVDELILSLENYLEGKSEWVVFKQLDIDNKEDWLFQENVLLTEHLAITRATESSEWVSLMISKDGLQGNTKLEAKVKIGESGHGIGLLLCVPENMERRNLTEGYCLWLASSKEGGKTTKLLLSSVSVLEAPEIALKPDEWHTVRIEKVGDQISFYLNDVQRFSYVSHIPVVGTQVGLLARDADFEIDAMTISLGSQNINVSCLAVPDAYLASKQYSKALQEYRRIGHTFLGRQEGREALFRAGMTLLEQAKDPEFSLERRELFEMALDEFGQLRNTPGAPLEYLGKSFVYKELEEDEEEAKCFELALRRYKLHPLLPILEEQIVFRMHESSHQNRVAAYHFICLVSRFLTEWSEGPVAKKLFSSLQSNWEVPFFVLHPQETSDAELRRLSISLGVGFWLAKPYIIAETLEEILARPIVAIQYLADAIFMLVELGARELAKEKMMRIRQVLSVSEQERFLPTLELLDLLIGSFSDLYGSFALLKTYSIESERVIWFLLRHAIDLSDEATIDAIAKHLLKHNYKFQEQEVMDALLVEHLLYQGDIVRVEAIFKNYSTARLMQEACPLYFVYGCYLVITEGVPSAMNEFCKLLDIAFPRSWVLGAHFLAGKIHMTPAGWFRRSFAWERRALYQQLRLFWHSAKDQEKSEYWKNLLLQDELYERS